MVNWGIIYQWRLRVNIRDVFYASVSHVLNLTTIGEIANAFNPVLAILSPPNHLCSFSLPLITSAAVTSVVSDSVWPHRRQPTRLCRPWDSPGKNTGVGCHFLLQCMKVESESEVAQSCLTLSDPMDCSLPGSSVHGIFQARVLEWGAIAFSNLLLLFYSNFLIYYFWCLLSPRCNWRMQTSQGMVYFSLSWYQW